MLLVDKASFARLFVGCLIYFVFIFRWQEPAKLCHVYRPKYTLLATAKSYWSRHLNTDYIGLLLGCKNIQLWWSRIRVLKTSNQTTIFWQFLETKTMLFEVLSNSQLLIQRPSLSPSLTPTTAGLDTFPFLSPAFYLGHWQYVRYTLLSLEKWERERERETVLPPLLQSLLRGASVQTVDKAKQNIAHPFLFLRLKQAYHWPGDITRLDINQDRFCN